MKISISVYMEMKLKSKKNYLCFLSIVGLLNTDASEKYLQNNYSLNTDASNKYLQNNYSLNNYLQNNYSLNNFLQNNYLLNNALINTSKENKRIIKIVHKVLKLYFKGYK